MSVATAHERVTAGASLPARAGALAAAVAPQLLLVIAAVGAAWRSGLLLVDQAHALVLPGAVAGAGVALALVVLVHRVPGRSALPFDDETDVIVSFMFAVLGAWLLYWTPTRLGVQYWLWRPDVPALALCGLALTALIGGSGLVLYIGPSVALAVLVMSPLGGLLVHQHSSSLAAVAVLSAVGATLPLLVARPVKLSRVAIGLAAAIAAGAAALAVGHIRHLSSGRVSLLAAGLALVAVECVILYGTRSSRSPLGVRAAPLAAFRICGGIILALGFGALDGLIPVFSGAQGNAVPTVLKAGPQELGTLDSPGGVQTVSWKLPAGGASHALGVEVFASTGPTAAAVLTYPIEGLISFIGQPCPNTRSFRLAGQKVTRTEYANNQAGTMWDLYSWSWHAPGRYQRVTLVMAYGPQGDAPRMPALISDGSGVGLSTAGLFLANRHIVCYDGLAQRDAGQALTTQLIRSVTA